MLVLGAPDSAFKCAGPVPASIGCEVPLVIDGTAAGAEDGGGRGGIGWTVPLPDPSAVVAVGAGGVCVGPLKLIGCWPATICGVNT